MISNHNKLVIVTGTRTAGKTSLCRELANFGFSLGRDVSGIISPAVFENEKKNIIEVMYLRTGERMQLATTNIDLILGPVTGSWYFSQEALNWGNHIISISTPCDILVIDELGILEFERGEGWLEAFDAIDSDRYKLGFVTIRPELLDRARRRWPEAGMIWVTEKNIRLMILILKFKLLLWNLLNF